MFCGTNTCEWIDKVWCLLSKLKLCLSGNKFDPLSYLRDTLLFVGEKLFCKSLRLSMYKIHTTSLLLNLFIHKYKRVKVIKKLQLVEASVSDNYNSNCHFQEPMGMDYKVFRSGWSDTPWLLAILGKVSSWQDKIWSYLKTLPRSSRLSFRRWVLQSSIT